MKTGFVSILGRPNAGKSTLLNAVLGQKLAIVTSKPQTTRTSIQGVVTTDDYQIVFIDTPGIHRSNTLMNKRMMDTVRASASADVVLFLIDVLEPFSEEDAQAIDLVKKLEAPAIAVLNKVDKLPDKTQLLALIERLSALHPFAEIIPISAMKGTGVDTLVKEIVKRLPEGEPMYPEDHLTDQPSRFLAAEILREKILHHTQQEVPHAVAVMIDSWVETPTLLKIMATIYVEKPGQKAILIGAGGAGLKKIGTLARFEMEKTFERKIFLQTFVKVKPNWRQDPEFLAAIDWRSMSGQ
ncbi:MAG TPA: GTPase Era [Bryobacteraceae bacterium]|jgi:GTP-binding protein Era|nr:GTPase Era [Bryobacteraceae bacterium]